MLTKIKIYYLFTYYHILLKKHGIKFLFNKLSGVQKPAKEMDFSFNEIKKLCMEIEEVRAKHVLKDKALCLHRSLVGYKLLREKGIDINLCIGIAKKDFEAHAWLLYENEVINDDENYVSNFNIIFQTNTEEGLCE
ncbi:lasso peptide biosynthesis B2 protein [Cytobacillus firmus]|uniref:Microcin J25-processing protein McjB C-terminal domain-containing protein n=1 Tax=Cytobacillus firmus DS1 TaxID=1307436 RepID=W7KR61_CYTFI|nr:lasso peptide biosynthesis B2 protein [Cytobacillus firmus]EWG08613.1 hypothetical protein PBF_23228 [Cytobacillus firmus DS1]